MWLFIFSCKFTCSLRMMLWVKNCRGNWKLLVNSQTFLPYKLMQWFVRMLSYSLFLLRENLWSIFTSIYKRQPHNIWLLNPVMKCYENVLKSMNDRTLHIYTFMLWGSDMWALVVVAISIWVAIENFKILGCKYNIISIERTWLDNMWYLCPFFFWYLFLNYALADYTRFVLFMLFSNLYLLGSLQPIFFISYLLDNFQSWELTFSANFLWTEKELKQVQELFSQAVDNCLNLKKPDWMKCNW